MGVLLVLWGQRLRRDRWQLVSWVVAIGAFALFAAAAVGVGIARYYVLITLATLVSLWNYLRRGVPANWEPLRE